MRSCLEKFYRHVQYELANSSRNNENQPDTSTTATSIESNDNHKEGMLSVGEKPQPKLYVYLAAFLCVVGIGWWVYSVSQI
jgi:hypothetical protein